MLAVGFGIEPFIDTFRTSFVIYVVTAHTRGFIRWTGILLLEWQFYLILFA